MLNAYPILTIESQSNLERINKYLDRFVNLISIGRNAQFEYLHTIICSKLPMIKFLVFQPVKNELIRVNLLFYFSTSNSKRIGNL